MKTCNATRVLIIAAAAIALLTLVCAQHPQKLAASTTDLYQDREEKTRMNEIMQSFESAAVDREADDAFTKQFLANHTEFYETNESPTIKFIGVFYDDMDLAKVKYRVYHVMDSAGIVSAFFYADVSQDLITHIGTGESMYWKLMYSILSSLSGLAEDVRPQLTGITEVVFVKEYGEPFYKAATISSPNLRETDLRSLNDIRNLNVQRNDAHADYVSAQRVLEETLPSDNPAADVIRDLSPAEP